MPKTVSCLFHSRAQLLCCASAAAIIGFGAAGSAFGQETATQNTDPAAATGRANASVAEVVVTGSRIARDGYQAPTPVTVLGQDTLDAMAKINITDAINQLPQLMQSVTPTAQPAGYGGGALGVNELNLRSLGSNRTLVLQDGKRMINASISNNFAAPDANTIPSALVSHVDIVTGGASAAYGSDALAGVVNFALDHNFTGIKGQVEGGRTTYGDDAQYSASLAMGTSFGPDARAHFLFSGEISKDEGITGNTRPWNANNASVITNPAYTSTNGQPFFLVARQIGLSNGTPGGLITSGPLQGTLFGPNGTPTKFNYGLVSTNNVMSGGDWQYSRIDNGVNIDPELLRKNVFSRASYAVSDNVELYGEFQWASTDASNAAIPNFLLGNGLSIKADNAFIPAPIATQMAALNLPSFSVGTSNGDIGIVVARNRRTLTRWNVGGAGKFSALGSEWKWDAYYQHNGYEINSQVSNDLKTANYSLATDAVRNPATGAIVCRSTLANPGNGCVPFNAMGTGVNTRAAINYVTGLSYIDQTLNQDVAAVNFHGEPISTWAGPVSVAFGGEHRRESITGLATPLDEANGYSFGNYHATHGAYDVNEGYIETVVPLAKNMAWAKALDLNAAVRETNYSTSGSVTTWKAGLTYSPVEDVRFRTTRSRDIRAPNLGELFAAGQASPGAPLSDPFTNTQVSNSIALASGNRNLVPEVADTTEFGVVLSPSFLPGFQASVDWYSIDVANAVQIPNAQTVVNLCFNGNAALCPGIQRTGGVISLVVTSPANIASQKTQGIDFEASYRVALADVWSGLKGDLSVRALGTYVLSLETVGQTGAVEGAGVLGGRFGAFGSTISTGLSAPKFVSTVFVNYQLESLTAQLTVRYVGEGVYNNAFSSCSSACPVGSRFSINDNHIPSNTIVGLSLGYKPFEMQDTTVFMAIDNILNAPPPIIGGNTINTYYLGQANSDYYDRVGRTVRIGLRFKL